MTFAQLAAKRCSVRKFDRRPIEEEKLARILEAGRLAPTACNYQPQRILLLRDGAVDQLQDCTPCLYGQSAAMVICYDRNECWKNRSGKPIGDVDATIVMTSMMYQAEELGIGSLLVGIFHEALLRERFRIPDHYEVVCLLMLGYSAGDYVPHPKLHASRKPLEETVFRDTF